MSGSHKEFPKKAVSIQLGLAALVGIGFLVADKPAIHAMADKETKPIVAAATKALAPIGKVEVKQESAGAAIRSAEEIFTSTCAACHNTGVAGAPKLDDKAAWETRLSDGFAEVVAIAIQGKGAMPARGGNPDFSDSEMELTVGYMIKKAGIDLVARSANSASDSTPNEKPAMAAVPKVEAATTAVVEKVVETKDAIVDKAEDVVEQVKTDTNAAVETAKEVVTEAKTDAVAAVATTDVAEVDHSVGEAIYKGSCFACHAAGVAGSPKFGDKEAWAPRIATGMETLYHAAINGIGAMPAKGGNASISDADIKAAVDYMTSQAQ